jgi:hypothetical protein
MDRRAQRHQGRHERRRAGRFEWRQAVVPFIFLALSIAVPIVEWLSRSPPAPDMPVSFGPGNTCYYVQSQAEVAGLIKQGHCPVNAVPAQAPQSWLVSYYPLYRSSWYEDNFVPQADRTAYSEYLTNFGTLNAAAISRQAPKARYVDGSGDVVSGSDVGVSGDGTSITEHGGGFGGFGGGGGEDGGHGFGGGAHGGE